MIGKPQSQKDMIVEDLTIYSVVALVNIFEESETA